MTNKDEIMIPLSEAEFLVSMLGSMLRSTADHVTSGQRVHPSLLRAMAKDADDILAQAREVAEPQPATAEQQQQ